MGKYNSDEIDNNSTFTNTNLKILIHSQRYQLTAPKDPHA